MVEASSGMCLDYTPLAAGLELWHTIHNPDIIMA
jgi:hypothetical protein